MHQLAGAIPDLATAEHSAEGAALNPQRVLIKQRRSRGRSDGVSSSVERMKKPGGWRS